ncbi:MAG: glycosyl transferase group 1 [Frankiales bacterium]|nr:glycosyl transferase group 1 [Frankiales bacterium]
MGIRVLAVDDSTDVRGAQLGLLRLAKPLSDRGVEVTLASPPDLELADAWRAAGLQHLGVELPRNSSAESQSGSLAFGRMVGSSRRTIRALSGLARGTKSDLMLANGEATQLDVALAARLAALPAVLALNQESPSRLGRLLRSSALASSRCALAATASIAAEIPRSLRSFVSVVGQGVDTDTFLPAAGNPDVRAALGSAPGELLVVAITHDSASPSSNIGQIIEAMSRLPRTASWHLAVVGEAASDERQAGAWYRQGQEMLGDRVTFTGWRTDIVEVLQAADVLVHPGQSDGMPLALLEAQSCGVPVVAYRDGGIPEAVIGDVSALLADPGDTGAFAEHLRRLLDNPVLRQRLGGRGRAWVIEQFGLSSQADSYANLLTNIAGNGIRHAS